MGLFDRMKSWASENIEISSGPTEELEGAEVLATRNITIPEPNWVEDCETRPGFVEGPGDWQIGYTVVTPTEVTTDETVVFIHGGAFVTGMYENHWRMLGMVARQSARRCVMVDYRHPRAHEWTMLNAIAAIDAIMSDLRAGQVVDPPCQGLVLLGEGPGANLAIAACYASIHDDRPLPDRLAVLSPMLALAEGGLMAKALVRMVPGLSDRTEVWSQGLNAAHPFLELRGGPFHLLPPTLAVTSKRHPGYDACVQFSGAFPPADHPIITLRETDQIFHLDMMGSRHGDEGIADAIAALTTWLSTGQ